MKAAVLEHYGAPQEFKIKDLAAPALQEGQLLVRNHASSVNPIDVLVRQGTLRLVSGLTGEPVIGSDFCGTVTESRSSRFQPGDEVFGFVAATTGQAYAELVAVDADLAAPKPTTLSFVEAGVLPMVTMTAYQGLVTEGGLQAGQRVLINGCTGGVGGTAVQIAKALGATVVGTCQGEHMDQARALGCDQVLNYETEAIPQDHTFDLILDTAAKLTLTDVEASLTEQGVLVTTKPAMDDAAHTVSSAVDLLKPRMKMVHAKSNPDDLLKIKAWVEQGKLRPCVTQTFPLAQIAQAHAQLEHGDVVGKVAIDLG